MSAIFGFASNGSTQSVSVNELQMAALAAANRGSDGWGLVAFDPNRSGTQRYRYFREAHAVPGITTTGIKGHLRKLVDGCTMVLGYCWDAYSGEEGCVDDIQPIRLQKGSYFAHVGNVPGYTTQKIQLGVKTETQIDGELIGRYAEKLWKETIYDKPGLCLQDACRAVTTSPCVAAWVWGNQMSIYRRDTPLWSNSKTEGIYFSSCLWNSTHEPNMLPSDGEDE